FAETVGDAHPTNLAYGCRRIDDPVRQWPGRGCSFVGPRKIARGSGRGLSNFHYLLATLKCQNQRIMNAVETFDERRIAAVPQSNPYQPAGVARSRGKVDEIFIFAYQYALFAGAV
ncbi:MAG: hypothetical protein ABSH22_12035, partial [Tepidisphaeraceae bacterium]